MKRLHAVLAFVDGGVTDGDVVEMACNVAKRNKARVHVIYVIEVDRRHPLTAELQSDMERGERVLESAERVADEAGYQIETEILQAREKGPAIVDEAVERGCDLIIMGISYQMRLGSFDIGGAANHVLKNSPVRVWLIRGAVGE